MTRLTAAEYRAQAPKKHGTPEDDVHKDVLEWLRWQFPRALIFHIPNGIPFGSKDKLVQVQIARAVARQTELGAMSGIPDLMMMHEGRNYFFEVKAPGNYATAEQRAVHDLIRACGGFVAVVRSIDDAEKALREWLSEPVTLTVEGVIS